MYAHMNIHIHIYNMSRCIEFMRTLPSCGCLKWAEAYTCVYACMWARMSVSAYDILDLFALWNGRHIS